MTARSPFLRSKPAMGVMLLVLGLAAGFLLGFMDAGPLVTMLVLAPLMVFGIWVGARWLASLDEVAREAHKWAWYWGGSIGMAAAGCVLIAVDAGGAPLAAIVPPWLADENPFVLGGLLVLLTEAVGYVGAWAAWWLARR